MAHGWWLALPAAWLSAAGVFLLWLRVDGLRAELRRLRAELDAVRMGQAQAAAPRRPVGQAAVRAPIPPPPVTPAATAKPTPAAPPVAVPARSAPVVAPAPAVTPAPTATPTPAATPGLEAWLGIKGAAVGAGLVGAIAAVLLFRHAVRNDWLTPALRVAFGAGFGVAAIAAAQLPRLRRFAISANALTGVGCVALYASAWAAHALYGLLPALGAAGAMVAVTALCCGLSLRHGSLQVALLALVGGFATPLMLSSGSDRPVALFGYLLVLDVAFLTLAWRRDWPVLAALSLVASAAFQVGWVWLRMDAASLWLGASVVSLFAVVFAVGGLALQRPERRSALLDATLAAAMLLPFACALYFVGVPDLRARPLPTLTLISALTLGAGWLRARAPRMGPLALIVGLASVSVLAVFVMSGPAWSAFVLVGVALTLHLAVELAADRSDASAWLPSRGTALAALVVLCVAAGDGADATLCGAALLLAASLWRQSVALPAPALATATSIGLVTALWAGADAEAAAWQTPIGLGLAAALAALPRLLRDDERRRALGHAAAGLAAACLVAIHVPLVGAVSPATSGFASPLGVTFARLGFTVLVLAASVWQARHVGRWAGLAALLVSGGLVAASTEALASPLELGLALLCAGALSLAPLVVRDARSAQRWRTAGWAPIVLFAAGQALWDGQHGLADALPALPALALSGLAGLCLALAARALPEGTPGRRGALQVPGAAAVLLAVVAVPLQLDGAWWTLAWALEGWLLVAWWRRGEGAHSGLAFAALALFAAVGVRLTLNPAVLDYWPRGALRVLNWLTPLYLAPAALAAHAGTTARALSVGDQGAGRTALSRALSSGLGALALLLLFAWANLMVVDVFAVGPTLRLLWQHVPSRDLAFSLTWAGFAIGLLALGMRRRIAALRHASLALLLATLAKVFLFDLGHLEDLQRVASLVGLAVSLFVVSLAYQRFFMRRPGADGAPAGSEAVSPGPC